MKERRHLKAPCIPHNAGTAESERATASGSSRRAARRVHSLPLPSPNMTHIAHCLRSPSGTTVETTYNYPASASVVSDPDRLAGPVRGLLAAFPMLNWSSSQKSVDLGQDSERTAVVRPTTTSRYQLWPSSRVTSPGPERPRALTTGRASSSLSDTAVDKGAESMFTKNTSFTGRRKHGLPEIHAGAMTTVHELPIDSRKCTAIAISSITRAIADKT